MSELNLNVPPPRQAPSPRRSPLVGTVLLLLLLAAAGQSVLLWQLRNHGSETPAPATGKLSTEALSDLALKLEKQGLQEQAVATWKEYLAIPSAAENQAKVWYRIGKLEQERRAYDAALAAFYRSESLAALPDLTEERNRRVQECLQASGRNAALDQELANRVSPGGDKATEEVLAEIGSRKITRGDLDRQVEEQIQRQLEAMASYLDVDSRKQQAESMRRRLTNDQARLQVLQQLVAEELLYRQAREEKLLDDTAVRAALDDLTRQFLAGQVMQKELARIQVTETDVSTWYQAHQKEYVEPERARLAHIQFADKEAAYTALLQLQKDAKFAELVKNSLDAATKDKGGVLEGWLTADGPVPGLGKVDGLAEKVFATEAGKLIPQVYPVGGNFHLFQVVERQPARQKPFDEVKQAVRMTLQRQKEQESQQALLDKLRERFNVVIHQSRFRSEKPESKQ